MKKEKSTFTLSKKHKDMLRVLAAIECGTTMTRELEGMIERKYKIFEKVGAIAIWREEKLPGQKNSFK